MSETHGRPSTMVPTAHKGHCTNIVLERDTEKHKRWTHWSPIPPTSGQKGGVTYQLEHTQLVTAIIESKIRQACKLYLRLKNDTGRRDTWIKQLVEAQAQDQKVTKKSIWKKICTSAKICNNGQMIKLAMAGTAPRQGLNHVIGPNQSDPTQQTESKTKTELENLSLAEAGRRFTQAAKTPFLQPPLIGIFTEANLSTQAFDQVLDRTFECPEGLNEMM